MPADPPPIPDALIDALRSASAVAVLTGAGVSAESGVPTFRDAPDALWARFNPSELANPEAFRRDPKLVTKWYDWRRQKIAGCGPNPGHHALAELERWLEQRGGAFTLLTQNVDRLHHAAGSSNVVELHGDLWRWRCVDCGDEGEDRRVPFPEVPVRCDRCGGLKRPGVVWFGEALPAEALGAADRALRSCDVFFSVGTSAVVEPAASFIHAARSAGAAAVEINPERTPITGLVDFPLTGPSGRILPALLSRLRGD